MHPILKSWRLLSAWIAGWAFFGAILTPVTAITGQMETLESFAVTAPLVAMMAAICLAPYYMCRALPLRNTLPFKLSAAHATAGLILTGVAMVSARAAAGFFEKAFTQLPQRVTAASPVLALIVLTVYCFSVAVHYAVLEVETSRRAELLAREAELKALKSQINPHFLFNSLNSISALTTMDASRAREMCVRLADFLRVSLKLGERTSVAFSEELALMKTYLDVEQVRFGDRLRLAMQIDDACLNCEIPALLIQPLVENAIKHGVAMLAEGGVIDIRAARDRDALCFSVENPFDADAPHQIRNGIGLRNVRERLEARYGAKANMKVDASESRYRVTITIPVKRI